MSGQLTSGLCPLCDAEFHDRDTFRDHLADAHGLEDDEGTETDFIPPFLGTKPGAEAEAEPEPEAPAAEAATSPAPAAPAATDEEATGHRKAILLVASLLVAAIGGAIALAGSGGGRPGRADRGNLATAEGVTTTAVAAPPTTVAVAAPTAPAATAPAAAPMTLPPAPDASALAAAPIDATPVSEPTAPPPAPPDTPPATEPFAPPLVFTPPTTTGATRDSCTRDKGRWVVTYRWQFVGGSAWTPSPEYVSLGGGRYQHTLSVKNGSTITAVLVTDPNGVQYSVSLDPPVSTSGC